jgi:LysM repeat protein
MKQSWLRFPSCRFTIQYETPTGKAILGISLGLPQFLLRTRLQGQHSRAEKFWTGAAIHASFERFKAINLSFCLSVAAALRYRRAAIGGSGSMVMTLEPRSVLGNICMSMMAASMAYMFIAMQLLMSPMPRASQLLAQRQQPVPAQSEMARGRYKPGSLAATEAPNAVASELERPPAETALPAVANTYIIVAGDTLRGIAAQLYGNAKQWRSIKQANRGLDPRRLHIGQALKLPSPISPR